MEDDPESTLPTRQSLTYRPRRCEEDLLENCSSKPLLVFSASVTKSSHRLLDVLFKVTPSISERLNTPSKRAELLVPS